MKFFWPKRSAPKGFSIDNLAKKYKPTLGFSSSDEFPARLQENDKGLIEKGFTSTVLRTAEDSKLEVICSHWANRDFKEYFDIA